MQEIVGGSNRLRQRGVRKWLHSA